jgi:hypothetical protein
MEQFTPNEIEELEACIAALKVENEYDEPSGTDEIDACMTALKLKKNSRVGGSTSPRYFLQTQYEKDYPDDAHRQREGEDKLYDEVFTYRRDQWKEMWPQISAETAQATKALMALEPTLPVEVSQYRATVETLICRLLAEIKSCDNTIAAQAADLKEHTNL